MAEHTKDEGKQSNAKEMPEAGTGSRDLSNWRKMAQVRAAMQADGNQQASSAVLGSLGLAANGQETGQSFSELERELQAAAELRAGPLAEGVETVNVNAAVNVNAGATVNVGGAALAVVVAAAAAAIPVIVLGAGVEE